jgi:hypothetical protein
MVNITAQNSILPGTTSAFDLGSTGNQWQTIYCVSLVQSSDPARKLIQGELTDYMASPEDFLVKIQPKAYYWRQGNLFHTDVLHFGPMADSVRDAMPVPFGGFYEGEFGELMIKPDELFWVHWVVTQRLLNRVAALEARLRDYVFGGIAVTSKLP